MTQKEASWGYEGTPWAAYPSEKEPSWSANLALSLRFFSVSGNWHFLWVYMLGCMLDCMLTSLQQTFSENVPLARTKSVF